jgi:hypothetical protein
VTGEQQPGDAGDATTGGNGQSAALTEMLFPVKVSP